MMWHLAPLGPSGACCQNAGALATACSHAEFPHGKCWSSAFALGDPGLFTGEDGDQKKADGSAG